MKQLKIAIDYDNTYTADPELWDLFIVWAKRRGHIVFIATARSATRDINDQLRALQTVVPVYFCDGVAKRFWCLHFGPGNVDIWIDDKPENVSTNSTFPFSELGKWREECYLTEPGHPGIMPYAHLGEPLTTVNDALPKDVYVDFGRGGFVDGDGKLMSREFYEEWKDHWRKFPERPEELEHYKPEDVAIRNGRAVGPNGS